MKTALTKKTTFLASLLVVAGAWTIQSCSGDDGAAGAPGAAGAAGQDCTISGTTLNCGTGGTYDLSGGAPSGACNVMDTDQNGITGILLTCPGNPAKFIPTGGGTADCKVEIEDAVNGFVINCGGITASVALCGNPSDDHQVVYNPEAYECKADGSLVVAVGKCGASQIEYNKGTEFCQTNNALQTQDEPLSGVRKMPKCATVNTITNYTTVFYGTDGFCAGVTKKTTPKCVLATGDKVEFGNDEFCLDLTSYNLGQSVEKTCNTALDTYNTFIAGKFCLPGVGTAYSTVEDLCGDNVSATPSPILGVKYNNTQRCSESGPNGLVLDPCGTGFYNKDNFFCGSDRQSYVLCQGLQYNITTQFCLSENYGYPGRYLDAKDNGEIKSVCKIETIGTKTVTVGGVQSTVPDTVVTTGGWNILTDFCATEGKYAGFVRSLCGSALPYNTDDFECRPYPGTGANDPLALVGKCGAAYFNNATQTCDNGEVINRADNCPNSATNMFPTADIDVWVCSAGIAVSCMPNGANPSKSVCPVGETATECDYPDAAAAAAAETANSGTVTTSTTYKSSSTTCTACTVGGSCGI